MNLQLPVWLPWIFLVGILFMITSYIISKVQKKQHNKIAFLQDFISGAILVSFAGVLVPDLFPGISLPTFFGGSGEDVQVGPPPLINNILCRN